MAGREHTNINVKGISFLSPVVLQEFSVRLQNASLPKSRVCVFACVEMVGTPFHATRSGRVVDMKGSNLKRTRAATPDGHETAVAFVWVVLVMTDEQKLMRFVRLAGAVASE